MPLTGYDLMLTESAVAPYGEAWPLSVAQADAQGTIVTQAQALLLRSDTAASAPASPARYFVLFFDDPQDALNCPGAVAIPTRVAGRLVGPAVLVTGARAGAATPLQQLAYQLPDYGISTPGGGRSHTNQPITFTISCSDPEGWAAIRFIDFRLSEHGTAVLMVRLDCPAKRLYVFDLAHARWVGGSQPGSAGSLATTDAGIVLPTSTVLGSTGTTGRLLLTLSFTSSASGHAFEQSVRVIDLRNQTRGWKDSGAWSVN